MPVQINHVTGVKLSGATFVKVFNVAPDFLFYTKENLDKNFLFNLPKGNYYIQTDGNIILTKPAKYKMPSLPKVDRKPKSKKVKMFFGENPNIASIWTDKQEILIDAKTFLENHFLMNEFVKCHEIGHLFYDSEENADKFAMRSMLKNGYNPSQLFFVINILRSEKRKKENERFITECAQMGNL